MPDQKKTTTTIENTFVCDCGDDARSACQGEPFFREHEGKRYCVLHYPGADKIEAFRVAFTRKLEAKDFDFGGVCFPEEVSFEKVEFSANAYFSEATFSAGAYFDRATFSARANFNSVTFSAGAKFNSARFSTGAYFDSATFSADANFYSATFSTGAYFDRATFCADAKFNSATFCADAYFDRATFSADAKFDSVTFSARANFDSATFSADANFNSATFSADANFNSVTFSADASFDSATFSAYTRFDRATFSADAYFNSATFSPDAFFYRARFNADAYFNGATFSAAAYFGSATFKSYISFAGSKEKKVLGEHTCLNFQFAHIEKPERVSFHTLDLKPHWFINCDCRKFEFTDCEWNHNLKQELEGASKLEVAIGAEISPPHRLLAIAYRQLADNAEANHRYHEASNLRYNAFEGRRIEQFEGFVPWRLDWWYWLASGYGERVGRAFIVFVALFALFAFGYGRSGFDQGGKGAAASVTQGAAIQPDTIGKPLDLRDAFIYSFYVTILQKPEPKPLTRTAKILVGLETVLGPAQAALLALAVRRRFMR